MNSFEKNKKITEFLLSKGWTPSTNELETALEEYNLKNEFEKLNT